MFRTMYIGHESSNHYSSINNSSINNSSINTIQTYVLILTPFLASPIARPFVIAMMPP